MLFNECQNSVFVSARAFLYFRVDEPARLLLSCILPT